MNINKKTLVLAIAAAMGVIPVVEAAALKAPLGKLPNGTAVNGPIYTPAESKENSVSYYIVYDSDITAATGVVSGATADSAFSALGGDLSAYVYTMPGYAVRASEGKSLQVKVTLTGGAKFVRAPSLICIHSGAAGGAAVLAGIASADSKWGGLTQLPAANVALAAATTIYRIPTSNLTPGLNSYNIPLPDGFTLSQGGSGACLLSFTAAAATLAAADLGANSALTLPAAASDVSLNVDVTYDDFFTKVTKSTAISMISFVTAYAAKFTQAVNPPTIDVASLSKKFLVGATTQYLGQVIADRVPNADGTARTWRNASGLALSATDIVSAASITISGPSIATLSKVSLTSAAQGSAQCSTMILEAAPAAVSGGASDSVTIAIGAASSGYGALVTGNVAQTHDGFNVCLVAEGNTKQMEPGYVTITVNGITTVGGKVVELGSSSSDFQVKRNGTVVRVLNVPGDPKDPYRVNIRMYNTSNQAINDIIGSLYGVDGKPISEKIVLASSLAPNNVKLLTSDSLATLVGKTWTGRAWMIIQAPVDPSGFKVQVLIKQPSGVLANISTDATD